MLSAEQSSLIETVAEKMGFKDFSVSVETGSKKGDNYLGNIFLINVKEKQGGIKNHSLILKCALENEQVRDQMPIAEFYRREVYLYDTVLPAFQKLQEKYALPHPFRAFAKMYGFSLKAGREWLLLENITARGFRMFDNKATAMNKEHVQMVFKEFGKLHSLSFVMEYQEPAQYQELKSNLQSLTNGTDLEKHWIESVKSKFDTNGYKVMDGDRRATEALRKSEKLIETSLKHMDEQQYKLAVVHGDPWCNNMMFTYYEDRDDQTIPEEVCFLDWQMSKVFSPVLDLCYFLLLCASKEVLDNHKWHFQQYHRIIEENLAATDLHVSCIFPYSVFEDHWKACCNFGLYLVIGSMETFLRNEDEAKTFTDAAGTGNHVFKAVSDQKNALNEQIKSRIRNVILMLVENNYL